MLTFMIHHYSFLSCNKADRSAPFSNKESEEDHNVRVLPWELHGSLRTELVHLHIH